MFEWDAINKVAALVTDGVDDADASTIADAIRLVARVRSCLDAFEIRLANRAEELNADGKCEPASSMLARNGRTSQKAGRRTAARAKAAAQAPAVQDALAAGEIT
ncbi:MAG: hypothetical protein ACOYL9_12890, partial [Ilumatobacteraceae bacterium]